MSIGDLAASFGLAPHVLRHWEDRGLLQPERTAAGRRVYTEQDRVRIGLILLGKEAGLSLEQTRMLFTGGMDRRRLYREHGAELRRRIAVAQAALAIVEHAAECREDHVLVCPELLRITGPLASGTRR
ncbi:hypothetical protein Acsp01_29740 [Actinoplanes sp. NBRC 101535]|nr:hypothetical protein Acsp01_29740 [Actinoplanes sp. NBRC 101535]